MTFTEAIQRVQSTGHDFHAWRSDDTANNQDILWIFKADGTIAKAIRTIVDGEPENPVESTISVDNLTKEQQTFLAQRVEIGVPISSSDIDIMI